MDSLTQIVLGAAVGEALLGRKVGNRAMLWGGICGTIPDLDVFSNAVSDPMSALAYHRAFTHSLAFAVLASPVVGLAMHRLYGGKEGPLKSDWVWPALIAAFFSILLAGSYLMPIEIYNIPQIVAVITGVVIIIFGVIALLRWARGFPAKIPNADWKGWTLLAFGAIVTHPLLDCFTAYGTQLFQPFAKSRVAWNTISVADPIYTLPFLLLLLWARSQVQGSGLRAKVNTAGLILSSIYLTLTIVNYFNVEDVLEDSLAAEGIVAHQCVHSPSILNNILWSATAKAPDKDIYYFSQYSLFDEVRRFEPWTELNGNHHLLAPYAEDRDIRIIRWFTKDYYNVLPTDTTAHLQVNDLRYGLLNKAAPDDPGSYIFSWTVDTTKHPVKVLKENAGPREGVDMGEVFGALWERVKGI
ncbi:MAG: metal-dependent hydrolase [Bacteroidota bacterium]